MWLGEGLGSISKGTHDRMLKWEFVDLSELRLYSVVEKLEAAAETEKLVVLPGFEVAQAKKRPVTTIEAWVQCFCRYTARMAVEFPACAPGFMAHMLTVLRAYCEVEGPAWRLYDVACFAAPRGLLRRSISASPSLRGRDPGPEFRAGVLVPRCLCLWPFDFVLGC